MVKRLLTRIPYRLRLSARFGSPLAVVRGLFRRHAGGLRAALDTLEPIPNTALLSAQVAKDRLREVAENPRRGARVFTLAVSQGGPPGSRTP